MRINKLYITNFKNLTDGVYSFGSGVNCIFGKNGSGKTNLLDAIYYLSFSKSAVNLDKECLKYDSDNFALYGEYEDLTIGLGFHQKKQIKFNGEPILKMRDIVGKVNLVLILPDHTSIIKMGGEYRRKFFDGSLAQWAPSYLKDILSYDKYLKQRNAYLKSIEKLTPTSERLLDTYDEQLIQLSKMIAKKRKKLVDLFSPYLEKNYESLHKEHEVTKILYATHVDEKFEEKFRKSRYRDVQTNRTHVGIHKDDFEFILNNHSLKKYGSQGQHKTFLLAIKLSLYDLILEKTGKKPLLLLDDIFDKLDDSRIISLLQILDDKKRFGQVFLTDARVERSQKLLEEMENVIFIEVSKGSLAFKQQE